MKIQNLSRFLPANWAALFVVLAFVSFPWCNFRVFAQEEHRHDASEHLGTVKFPVSCTPEAQAAFNRAMALYHSFAFIRAKQAFAEVLQIDPACGMAYWGQALAILENPFAAIGNVDAKILATGSSALESALESKSLSDRERAYISALQAFYDTNKERPRRDRSVAFEQALGRVAEQYPEDKEAMILYALAVSSNFTPNDKSYSNQLKAAKILEPLFREMPDHPGIAHYLIHSYDYPPLAKQGLDAARRYAGIAPDAPHALHMPSHIFTRLGYWQESIDTNRASATAGFAEKNHRYWLHAMDYMTYAHLQLAQDQEVTRLLEASRSVPKIDDNPASSYALAAMPSRYAVERDEWKQAASLMLTPSPKDFKWHLYPQSEAVLIFSRSLGAARSGDPVAARRDIERLLVLSNLLASQNSNYWAEQVDIQGRTATAWVLWAEGKKEEALAKLREAADAEDATEKNVVTPGPIIPARELLGDMLLESGKPREALEAYEAVMVREPNRFRTISGAARSAEAAGDSSRASKYYRALLELGKNGDRPELAKAKVFLAAGSGNPGN